MTRSALLQVAAASADRPLTPEQQKFNRLVQKIEQARAGLRAWQEQEALFARAHAERLRPLFDELAGCRRGVVQRLDALLAGKGWTRGDRATMREVICEVLPGLIEDSDAEEAEALKAIYDRHSEVDFDTENRAAVATMKDMFEAMSGVDLGDEAFESHDDLMRRARERLDAAAQDRAAAPSPKAGKASAAQRRREQEQQEASQSLREVYRKLASALHPDRAPDEAQRAERTALMQRVNQAYEARDLLSLFALQLEIEQVDTAHLARLTAERSRHYNRVLNEQLGALRDEIEASQMQFRLRFGLEPYLPLQAQRLGSLLEQMVRELRADVAQARRELRQLDDPVATKRWLKRMRAQMRDDDAIEMPF